MMRATVRKAKAASAARLVWLAAVLALASPAQVAGAQPMWDGTRLSEFRISGNSDYVADTSNGATNLSDGSVIGFEDWYSPDAAPDLRLGFLTPVSNELGLLWGFGTGEAGDRYRIQPSLKFGFVARTEIGDASEVVFRLSTVLGGKLKERSCTADYGAIGGVRIVNCRLSASFLAPEATLDHLFDRAPEDQVEMMLRYTFRF